MNNKYFSMYSRLKYAAVPMDVLPYARAFLVLYRRLGHVSFQDVLEPQYLDCIWGVQNLSISKMCYFSA